MDVLQKWKLYLTAEYESKNTKADYYCHIKQFLKHTDGIINNDVVTSYRAFLNEKYKNRNTRNKKIISVNQFLSWLGYSHLRCKNIGWEHGQYPTLKDTEISRLLEASYDDPELYLMVLLLWEACLRDDSIINLKISDRLENKLYLKKSKTGSKSVILSPRLVEAWTRYLHYRPRPKSEYQEYLFINPVMEHSGEKFQTINPVIRRIRNLGKRCNIGFDVTPYTIRRTSGTLRQDKFSKYYAGDVKIVQRMFNHKDVRTTLRYDNRTDGDVEKYLDSLYNDETQNINQKPQNYKQGLTSFALQNSLNQEDENYSYSFSISFDSFVLNWDSFDRYCIAQLHYKLGESVGKDYICEGMSSGEYSSESRLDSNDNISHCGIFSHIFSCIFSPFLLVCSSDLRGFRKKIGYGIVKQVV